jgi:hypothetical protein
MICYDNVCYNSNKESIKQYYKDNRTTFRFHLDKKKPEEGNSSGLKGERSGNYLSIIIFLITEKLFPVALSTAVILYR